MEINVLSKKIIITTKCEGDCINSWSRVNTIEIKKINDQNLNNNN